MNSPDYLIPQLRRRSLVVLCLWFIGFFALFFAVQWFLETPSLGYFIQTFGPLSAPSGLISGEEIRFAVHCFLNGQLLGSISGFCWLATAIKRSHLRYVTQLIVILLGAIAIHKNDFDQTLLLTILTCLGMILSQNLMFAWLGVPKWNDDRESAYRRRQFSIFDILIITTVVAVLFGIGRTTVISIEPLPFWVVWIAIWGVTQVVSVLTCLSFLNRRLVHGAFSFLAAIAIALATALGLAMAELRFTNIASRYFLYFAIYYGLVLIGFIFVMAIFAFAGRSAPEETVDLPDDTPELRLYSL